MPQYHGEEAQPTIGAWELAEVDGLKMWIDRDDDVSLSCINGSFEVYETAYIDNFLKPGMTFVDVGANIGWFSLRGARSVGKNGKVISIEPRTDTYEKLAASLRANEFEWATPYNIACGSERGTLRLGWANTSGGRGGTWLIPDDDLVRDFERLHKRVIETSVDMLDNIVSYVDLMKIDIEGAELLALRGANRILTQVRPTIICEINPTVLGIVSKVTPSDLVCFMSSFGYSCKYLEGLSLGKRYFGEDLPNGLGIINVIMQPELA